MREIGGYLELERFTGQEYYPDLFKLNLGRTAVTWFLKQVGCRTLYVPAFLCDSVTTAVLDAGIALKQYGIRPDFLPCEEQLPQAPLDRDCWIFVVNFYGQLDDAAMQKLQNTYGQVLFDMTHAFFHRPIPGSSALTSVRKFLGVTDGAYLQTDLPLQMPEKTDQSHERFAHILGRFEQNAGTFYKEMLQTAHGYVGAEAMRMSPITENLLKGLDYEHIASRRMENYLTLDQRLKAHNGLYEEAGLHTPKVGPFCYPMLVKDGAAVRKQLAARKIFVPTYWSNVISEQPANSLEYRYAANILALPCDQRYTPEDMDHMADQVLELLNES